MAQNPQHWSLDKRVPIAVVLAIVGQTFGAIWWASSVTSRIEILERARLELMSGANEKERRIQVLERAVDVMQNRTENIEKTTERIEKKLDKLSMNYPEKLGSLDAFMHLSLKELGEIRTV